MQNITIHKKEDFIGMRIAGKLAAQVLDYIGDYVKPGITTNCINQLCHDMIIDNGAIPAPLNYRGFPKSVCTSVNHVVCHGIPSDKELEDGDIINIDITVIVDGWHGDTSRTYYVGKPSIKAKRLVNITYESMMLAIKQVNPGTTLQDIGRTIETFVTNYGYSIVKDYSGHGIGKKFHAEPHVLHYYDPNYNVVLEEGMFFTIEPMVNIGKAETKVLHDNWTVVTKDKSLSAQFEHTIGVTSDGYEIFTLSDES